MGVRAEPFVSTPDYLRPVETLAVKITQQPRKGVNIACRICKSVLSRNYQLRYTAHFGTYHRRAGTETLYHPQRIILIPFRRKHRRDCPPQEGGYTHGIQMPEEFYAGACTIYRLIFVKQRSLTGNPDIDTGSSAASRKVPTPFSADTRPT